MMTIYLLIANILLLNLLIAVFNNTFARTMQESNQIWAFQRYEVIMQYEAHPILPPPLILFCHLKMLVDKFLGRRKKGRFRADRGLKLFLNENEEENLHDWEEDLVDDYYRLRRREDGKKFEEWIFYFHFSNQLIVNILSIFKSYALGANESFS